MYHHICALKTVSLPHLLYTPYEASWNRKNIPKPFAGAVCRFHSDPYALFVLMDEVADGSIDRSNLSVGGEFLGGNRRSRLPICVLQHRVEPNHLNDRYG